MVRGSAQRARRSIASLAGLTLAGSSACGAAPTPADPNGARGAPNATATNAASDSTGPNAANDARGPSTRFEARSTGEGLPARCEGQRKDAWCDDVPPGAITRLGHRGGAVGGRLAVTPDGARWATADTTSDICFWSRATGLMERCVPAVPPEKDESTIVVALAFTSNGERLAVLGHERLLLVDAATATVSASISLRRGTVRGPMRDDVDVDESLRAHAIASARDRIVVGVCSEQTRAVVRVLDGRGATVATRELPPSGSDREVCADAVALSPDGKLVVASRGNLVFAWDEHGELVQQIDTSDTSVDALAFRPDGAELAIGGWGDAINVVSTSSWKVTRAFGYAVDSHNGTDSLGWSRDGRFVAATHGDIARVWEAATSALAFSVDHAQSSGLAGDTLLALEARGARMVAQHALPTGERIGPSDLSRHPRNVIDVALSADAKFAATAGTDGVRTWDAETGRPLGYFVAPEGAPLAAVEVVAGGVVAAVTWEGDIHLLRKDAERGDAPFLLAATRSGDPARLDGVSASPDGSMIALTMDDGTLRRWVVESREELPPLRLVDAADERSQTFTAPVWSRDGATLAVGMGGEVWLLDAKTSAVKQRVGLLDRERVAGVAFAPDRDVLAILTDARVVLVDVTAGAAPKILRSFDRNDIGLRASIRFAAQGTRLVLAERSVHVYDVASGKRVSTFDPETYDEPIATAGNACVVGLEGGTSVVLDVRGAP